MGKFKAICKYVFNDRDTKRFIAHNKKIWRNKVTDENDGRIILLELCDLEHCIISWSYFSNLLAEKLGASVRTFGTKSSKYNFSLRRVYKSFNAEKHVSECLNDIGKKQKKEIFEKIYPTLTTKEKWLNVEVNGVSIGQDIYESYLIAGHATLDINDNFLKKLLNMGIEKVLFWKRFFAKKQVCAVIISHDCYMGNIIRRVGNMYNVPVYQITTSWGVLLREGYNSGSNFKYYREIFNKLSKSEQEAGVKWAKGQLERRFNGEIGVDMSYSKKSSFGKINKACSVLRRSNNIKVLICSHCFFDNPYCYGKFLFTDFYEWLIFLGEMSNKTKYDWYIKVHPDYRPGTLEKINEIIVKYPRIVLLPETVSHQQLVSEGIDFVLTVYGTVGCEYPLMGKQVINAGNNPHIAYDFCWNPRSLEEYKYLLEHLPTLSKNIPCQEVYEFYCVHHLYANYCSKYRGMDSMIFFSEKEMYQKLGGQCYSSRMYGYFLDEYSQERHEQIKKNVSSYLVEMNNYRYDMLPVRRES